METGNYIKKNRILIIIVALAALFAGALTFLRTEKENEYKKVSIIMTYNDIYKFASAADIGIKEALREFGDAGITGIVVNNVRYYFSEKEIEEIKSANLKPILNPARSITVEEYEHLKEKYGLDYPLYLSNKNLKGEKVYDYFNEKGLTFGVVENLVQMGQEDVENFDAENCNIPITRVFELKPFANRYAVLGYTGAEEIENILYRAVSDRNIRILCISPFVDGRTDKIVTDISEYKQVFENLAERMKPHGLILGSEFDSVTEYNPKPVLIFGCFLGICALAVLLLGTLVNLKSYQSIIITVVCWALSVGAWLVLPTLTRKAMALLVVSVMACLGVYYIVYNAKKICEAKIGFGKTAANILKIFFVLLLLLLLGGMFTGSVLFDSDYMLEYEMFRGVKISQIIPVAYAAFIMWKMFIYQKGRSLKSLVFEVKNTADRSKKIIIILVIAAILGALVLFILRTGDRIIQAGNIEQRFRIFFEKACIARPRTKEFLIAWPCLILGMFLLSEKKKITGALAIFFSSVGCASVSNTFCHIRAYYFLSVMRTAYGAAIGLVLGFAAVFVLLAAFAIYRKKAQKITK